MASFPVRKGWASEETLPMCQVTFLLYYLPEKIQFCFIILFIILCETIRELDRGYSVSQSQPHCQPCCESHSVISHETKDSFHFMQYYVRIYMYASMFQCNISQNISLLNCQARKFKLKLISGEMNWTAGYRWFYYNLGFFKLGLHFLSDASSSSHSQAAGWIPNRSY